MTKPTPMTDDQLKALTDAELRNAIGFYGGALGKERQKAMYYYLGEAKEDLAPSSIQGRSRVVSTDVRNTIEAMLPQLMVKFTGGDSVVEFEPTQPDDERKAKNCTDYLNYLFFKKNNGHSVTYTWFKDALMQKRGMLKVWWDDRAEETREEYTGQTPAGLAMLMDDAEIEVIEQKAYPDEDDAIQRQKAMEQLQEQIDQAVGDPQAGQMVMQIQKRMAEIQALPPSMLYDVTCKRLRSGGKVCVENVPPEEFLISRKAKTIADARMVGHVFKRTIGHLRSMGYRNLDDIGSGGDAFENSAEAIERDDDYFTDDNELSSDESQREVWIKELYIRCDYDGDGITELRKVTRCGDALLDNEIVDLAPFVSICPVPMPHKFYGLSVADLSFEGQKTSTAIMRAMLDNLYLEVNGRYFAVEGQVNLDDLLGSRPGGIVRTKAPGMVGRLDQGKGNLGESMQMLEYMKSFVEDSTGWSRQSQGNDAAGLKNETATAKNIVTNRADMRLDLIARNFAEGFVDLFKMMLKLVCQHQAKEASIRLSGEWVEMDPREWRNQFDVSINVGLGVGNKDQQVQHLMALQNAQVQGMAIGIANPQNLYESCIELAKNMGFKTGDKFFTKPDPNQPMPNPGAAEAQAKQQMHGADLQAKMQMHQLEQQSKAAMQQAELQQAAQVEQIKRQHEADLERAKMQMQAEVDNNRQRSEAEQQSLKIQQEAQLEQLKAQYEQERHARDSELAMAEARLKAETAVIVAQIAAANKPAPVAGEGESKPAPPAPAGPDMTGALAVAIEGFQAALSKMGAPRTIIRDADGRATGIQ